MDETEKLLYSQSEQFGLGRSSLNSSSSSGESRHVQRARKKAKFKIIGKLFGKKRQESRTVSNVDKAFKFLMDRSDVEFTGRTFKRNTGVRGTSAENLLDNLEHGHFVAEVRKEKGPGQKGGTAVYRLTVGGKILTAYWMEDYTQLLGKAIVELLGQEQNPIYRFCLEVFDENCGKREDLGKSMVKTVLNNSIQNAMLSGGRQPDIAYFIAASIQNAFKALPSEKQREWFCENVKIMEKSPHRDFLFLFFKTQLESHVLTVLKDHELQKYVEALKNHPENLHLPRKTSSGFEVVETATFENIDTILDGQSERGSM